MTAVLDVGIDLTWEPLVDVPHVGRIRSAVAGDAPGWLRGRRSLIRPDETLVVHTLPRTWHRLRGELSPWYFVGHSVWETETLPKPWVNQMECADEIWVPTQWNRSTYADVLDKPIRVIPHVISTDEPADPPIEIPEDAFVFTCISAWDWRKRPDRTIQAFLDAFTADDPVVLVVKTGSWPTSWYEPKESTSVQVQRLIDRYPRPARVLHDTSMWTHEQVLGLLERTDCFVSLTSSEGWGLGAFDAACRGKPILITGWGGQVEWLGSEYPGLIPYTMVPIDHPDTELFDRKMTWAYADTDTAIDMMREVVGSPSHPLRAAAAALAPRLNEMYSPSAVGKIIHDAIADLPRPSSAPRATAIPKPVDTSVLVLSPVKNAARHAPGYVDRVLALNRPGGGLSVAVLVSDSDDGTADAFRSEFERLQAQGIPARVFERDFGYRIPEGVPRWEPSIQLERRKILALSRNHLLFAALGDEEWVLWVDADVVSYPSDLIERLVATGGDIVQPDCVKTPGGASFDLNAWTDEGRWHLHDYREFDVIDLHAVGGTVLLVRADRHRDGLIWPAYLYGNDHPRKRRNPQVVGRSEIGEIETEGLAMMAYDMGIACIGVPSIQVIHETPKTQSG